MNAKQIKTLVYGLTARSGMVAQPLFHGVISHQQRYPDESHQSFDVQMMLVRLLMDRCDEEDFKFLEHEGGRVLVLEQIVKDRDPLPATYEEHSMCADQIHDVLRGRRLIN